MMSWKLAPVWLLLCVAAAAQSGSEGSLEGTVTDPTSAAVPGAVVRATRMGTSSVHTTSSDAHGLFRFPVLAPGSYEVSVESPGFRRFIQHNIEIGVGAKVDLPVRLAIGAHADSVVVNSEAPLVETTRSQFSTTVNARSVANLPLNGRNFLNFVALTPGVSDAPGSQAGYNFAGQLQFSSLVVDGADQNGFQAAPVGTATPNRYLFSQESIQEFQVNTNSYSAEFGRAGTAVVNVITKSGTNDFHGALFWYFRDRGLNANSPINKMNGDPKGPFHAHQFGGALGGPVRKDRLFFYGSYDGQRRSEQNLTMLNLPSGFSLSPNPATAHFQQVALDYLEARASPYVRTFNQNVGLARLDWIVNPANTFSARWDRHRLLADNLANVGPQQSLEHTGATEQIVDSAAVWLNSTISPNAVNVASFSYVSSAEPQPSNSTNPEATVLEGGQQVLLVGGAARLPVSNDVKRAEWSETLSLSRGRHAPKFGVNILLDRGRFFSALNFFASYRFNTLASFGRSLSGTPVPQAGDRYVQAFSGIGQPPISVNPNYVEVAAFAQDEWRIRPSLTLTAGLRYDVQVMTEVALHNPAAALAQAGIDTGYIPTDRNNLAPRVGIAWSPLRSNRLVMRAGYGLYFPRLVGATAARAYFQNGITTQTRTFAGGTPTAALIPAYPNNVCGPPSGNAPNCPAPATAPDILMAFPAGYRQSVVQQDNVSIEYQVAGDFAVSVTYLGTKGVHLQHWQDANLPAATLATIGLAGTSTLLSYRAYTQPRPIVGFDRVLLLQTNGNSVYHALAVQASKRFSRHFQFQAAYTYSETIDDNPTIGALNPGPGDGGLLSDSGDTSLDRGLSDADQRHRLVLYGLWELKYGSGLPRAARVLLGGWQLSGIFLAASGEPYSGLVNFDLNNDGNAATDRPPGLARNTFVLPSVITLDSRVTRTQRLNERVTLQVNWDAFNLFNRANFNSVRTTLLARSTTPATCAPAAIPCLAPQITGAAAFGTPTGALDPRVMQFSAVVRF
ncbi:MAG: carboxypeptidase regulatory-like domain-containing protein [Acidobacteriia bacterium]|nr:carboxypeptidase regulatory-like domain-containing protein [Terriglobia bacterium]